MLRFLPPFITCCLTMLDMQDKDYLDFSNAQSTVLLFCSIYFILLGLLQCKERKNPSFEEIDAKLLEKLENEYAARLVGEKSHEVFRAIVFRPDGKGGIQGTRLDFFY